MPKSSAKTQTCTYTRENDATREKVNNCPLNMWQKGKLCIYVVSLPLILQNQHVHVVYVCTIG